MTKNTVGNQNKHPSMKDIDSICNQYQKQKDNTMPPQTQAEQPGDQATMQPTPISIYEDYHSANKLKNKVVLITGGDSGIGRAVAYHAAAEGATVFFTYLNEAENAKHTEETIRDRWQAHVTSMQIDLAKPENCKKAVATCLEKFNQIDVLVNNMAVQYSISELSEVSAPQLDEVFHTNFYSYFFMTQAALPHLKNGAAIINSSSVTAFRGSSHLIEYSATKGAIISFTRSLAKKLKKDELFIRVNAVAPGPVWTPLIPASFSEKQVAHFGQNTLTEKPAHPADIAPSYIFLACQDSRFITGQTLHPNGGEIINT